MPERILSWRRIERNVLLGVITVESAWMKVGVPVCGQYQVLKILTWFGPCGFFRGKNGWYCNIKWGVFCYKSSNLVMLLWFTRRLPLSKFWICPGKKNPRVLLLYNFAFLLSSVFEFILNLGLGSGVLVAFAFSHENVLSELRWVCSTTTWTCDPKASSL